MQLEDYFNFLAPNDIRLKGTRVGIETVLYDYIHRCQTPEEIAQSYSSITLEQVYATILYYLHNKEEVSDYIASWLDRNHKMLEEQRRNPPSYIAFLKLMRGLFGGEASQYRDSRFRAEIIAGMLSPLRLQPDRVLDLFENCYMSKLRKLKTEREAASSKA